MGLHKDKLELLVEIKKVNDILRLPPRDRHQTTTEISQDHHAGNFPPKDVFFEAQERMVRRNDLRAPLTIATLKFGVQQGSDDTS